MREKRDQMRDGDGRRDQSGSLAGGPAENRKYYGRSREIDPIDPDNWIEQSNKCQSLKWHNKILR